ncbi:MAG: RNA-protein complex protein Nop10 [Candidatus Micrarchaeota archaeon]|nr:RNA-protein complex protein Nop10 [Candidatus Micrarchaeota archaeon]
MKKMRKCALCGKYTLEDSHCNAPTKSPHPAKFSIDDKHAKYRRMAKER